LSSVLAQTTQPDQIIVVDDGSTDGTQAVASSFGDQVTLIRQVNRGSAVARQVGTEMSSSEYVAYLDADDWWTESHLGEYAEICSSEDVHFLLADFVRARPGSAPSEILPRNTTFHPWFLEYLQLHAAPCTIENLYHISQPNALDALLRGFPCYPSTMLVRRSSMLAVGGWDGRFRRCQDFDIALRLARRYPLHFLNQIQATVGINEGNETADRYVIQQTEGDIFVLKTLYDEEARDHEYRQQVAIAIARKCYRLGEVLRQSGDKPAARQAYLECLRWPSKRAKAFLRMLSTAVSR
jgi:glycosyltransferase involved in cell wall biosynthesis